MYQKSENRTVKPLWEVNLMVNHLFLMANGQPSVLGTAFWWAIIFLWCREEPFGGPSFYFVPEEPFDGLLMGHHFFRWCEQCFGGGAILHNNHVINPNNLLIFPDGLCNLDVFMGTDLPLYRPLITFVGSIVWFLIDCLLLQM